MPPAGRAMPPAGRAMACPAPGRADAEEPMRIPIATASPATRSTDSERLVIESPPVREACG